MNTAPSILEIGSITQQTPWKVEIVNFGRAMFPGVDYFNPSIVQRPDGIFMIVRRSRWSPKDHLGMNDLMAFEMNGSAPVRGQKIIMHSHFDMEHFEDPRAMYHDGKTFISCCNFLRTRKGCCFPHQMISEVDSNWNTVQRYDPSFGFNGDDVGRNTGHEKNWLWFWRYGLPNMVYAANPHKVVEFSEKFDSHNGATSSQFDSSLWKYGEIRGGTPPVLVGGEYYTFFHSSTPWSINKRQYHMGCYAFEAKPPFRITKITLEPLLSGSRMDPWDVNKPLVVFPGGAIYQNRMWTVVGGVNDLRCFWAEIPHDELQDKLIEI